MGASTQNKAGSGEVILDAGIIRVSVSGPSVIIIVIKIIAHMLGSCFNAWPSHFSVSLGNGLLNGLLSTDNPASVVNAN
jgi:hypothetical protein